MKSDGTPPHQPTGEKKKLEEKKNSFFSQAQGKLHAQWASLAAAKPNSFKGIMHRLSQAVLEREDPDAAFLRSLPSLDEKDGDGDDGGEEEEEERRRRGESSASSSSSSSPAPPPPLHFTLHHPTTQPERLVRRRTRLLVRRGRAAARRRLWGWGAVTLPLLPVLLTPLPALPLYYSIWKAWTARAALRGSRGLAEALDALAEEQSAGAAAAVAAKAAAASADSFVSGGGGGGGGEGENGSKSPGLPPLHRSGSLPPRGSWADAALAAGPTPAPGQDLDIFQEGEVRGKEEKERPPPQQRPRISFVAQTELDDPAVDASSSSSSPSSSSPSSVPPLLSLEAAEALEKGLNAPGLKEGVRRVLRRARKEVEEEGGEEAAKRRKEGD